MNIKLRKRIIGFLLLVGVVLILVPILFNHAVSVDQLKLSGDIPASPEKPSTIDMPIPAQASLASVIPTLSTQTTNSDLTISPAQVQQLSHVNQKEAAGVITTDTTHPVSILPASSAPSPLTQTVSAPIEKTGVNSTEKAAIDLSPDQGMSAGIPLPTTPLQSSHSLGADASTNTSLAATVLPIAATNSAIKPVAAATVTAHAKNLPVATTHATVKTTTNAPAASIDSVKPNVAATKTPRTVSSTLLDSTKPSIKAIPTSSRAPEKTVLANNLKISTKNKEASNKTEATLASNTAVWSVQVGSFHNKNNADHVVTALKNSGFLAYLTTVQTGKGELLKVIVGTGSSKIDANKMRSDIQEKLNMQGILIQLSGPISSH